MYSSPPIDSLDLFFVALVVRSACPASLFGAVAFFFSTYRRGVIANVHCSYVVQQIS